jgi:dCMP deaminase
MLMSPKTGDFSMLTPKWDARFLLAAAFFAGFSKDPSTKCGCVLATPRRRIVGFGYNGRPQGVDDSPIILNDRPRKLLSTVHAEINTLTFLKSSTTRAPISWA